MRSTLRFKSRMSARTSLRSSRISDSQPAKPCSTAPRRLPRRQAAPLTAKTIVAPTVAMAMMMGVASKAVLLVRQPRDAGAFRHYAHSPWLGRFANPPPTARCLFVAGGKCRRQFGGGMERFGQCARTVYRSGEEYLSTWRSQRSAQKAGVGVAGASSVGSFRWER